MCSGAGYKPAPLSIHPIDAHRLKRILEMFDPRTLCTVRTRHRDDIKSRAALEQVMSLQIGQRQPRHPPLLLVVDRFGGMTGVVAGAGLHFDEDDSTAI